MSATTIIDTAPLGALIRYTDDSPKPPARFTKKLAAWERSNGVGRLVKKEGVCCRTGLNPTLSPFRPSVFPREQDVGPSEGRDVSQEAG